MLWQILLALLVPPLLLLGWVGVQRAWRREFPARDGEDGDALAGRTDCGRCDCSSPCGREDEPKKLTVRRS